MGREGRRVRLVVDVSRVCWVGVCWHGIKGIGKRHHGYGALGGVLLLLWTVWIAWHSMGGHTALAFLDIINECYDQTFSSNYHRGLDPCQARHMSIHCTESRK